MCSAGRVTVLGGACRSSLFVPQETFELLVRRQIRRLEAPCLEACELVEAELIGLCEEPNIVELRRYPALETAMVRYCCTTYHIVPYC